MNVVSSVPCEDTELLTERHNDNTNWVFFLLSSIEKTASCGFCWFFSSLAETDFVLKTHSAGKL